MRDAATSIIENENLIYLKHKKLIRIYYLISCITEGKLEFPITPISCIVLKNWLFNYVSKQDLIF